MISAHRLKVASLGLWSKQFLVTTVSFQPIKFIAPQQRRLQSNKVNCAHLVAKCGDRFKQRPCDVRQLEIKLKQPAPKPLPAHMRSIELKHPKECCGDPCQDALPRFDTLYYQRTDKLNREYPQTWSECPNILMKPKLVCRLDKIQQPKLKKRPRQHRPATACKQVCASTNSSCPFVSSPRCREALHPPKCRPSRAKTVCFKRKAPLPAFSETARKRLKADHPLECNCLLAPSMCEVWAYYHYVQRIKKLDLCQA